MKQMQKCLVMGGAGMLGYEIVRQLLSEGMSVRVLDLAAAARAGSDRRLEAMIGDIRNPQAVTAACDGVDTVFQTAAAVWDVRTPEGLRRGERRGQQERHCRLPHAAAFRGWSTPAPWTWWWTAESRSSTGMRHCRTPPDAA